MFMLHNRWFIGGNIVSDANAVSGTFAIWRNGRFKSRWRTGTRVFRLTSSSTNDRVSDIETRWGRLLARGTLETVEKLYQQEKPRLVRENTNETRTIARTSTRTAQDKLVGGILLHKHSWLMTQWRFLNFNRFILSIKPGASESQVL